MEELFMKRLAVIKRLYEIGLEQSYMSEPMNGFCLLSFHDSVEMFMKLCSDFKGGIKVKRDTKFMEYFSLIPDLTMDAQMQNLNYKRVALKHYGSLPSKLDVEISRANTTDFLETNTLKIFDVSFDELSLVWLIKYDEVKEYLTKAEQAFITDNYEESILNSHIAFSELIICYEADKNLNYETLFHICENMRYSGRSIYLDNELDEYIKKVNKALLKIDEAIKIIGLGIDYKRFVQFNILSPEIQCWPDSGKRFYENFPNKKVKHNKKNSRFCFDFVIDSALKLQEFDFEISELIEKDSSNP